MSNPQKQQFALLAGSWAITACWLCDPQAGKQRCRPFGNQGFRERQSRAEYLRKLTELCDDALKYSTKLHINGLSSKKAHELKVGLIHEWRNWGIEDILTFDSEYAQRQRQRPKQSQESFQALDEEGNLLAKRQRVKKLKALHKWLEEGENPFKPEVGQMNHYVLLERAISIVRRIPRLRNHKLRQRFIDFRAQRWRPFLKSLDKYIKDLHNSDLKVALPYEDYLKYQAEGNYQGNIDLSKSIVLRIDPVFLRELEVPQ